MGRRCVITKYAYAYLCCTLSCLSYHRQPQEACVAVRTVAPADAVEIVKLLPSVELRRDATSDILVGINEGLLGAC
jgi:hypothetical protein